MIDHEPHDHDFPPVTVRPAGPADERALEEASELDGRLLGPAPRLVAESDGAIVAALSLTDGSVVADPFRFTLEAVALLQRRAGELRVPDQRRAARALRALRRGSARRTAVTVTALAALLIGVSVGEAAPRPALPAGTWVGSGTATGTSSEGGMTSKFSARLRFSFVVGPNGRIRGKGTFASDMTVTGEIASVVSSTADVVFRGTSSDIAYSGTAATRATFETVTRTLKPIVLRQRLPISRAGACTASGSFVLNGVTLRWSATRKIVGTCRT